MKISRVLINGILIYIGIAIIFVIMEALGLSDEIYLRLLNFAPVIWGINRTIKSNYADHMYGYFANLISAIFTGIVSLFLTIASFVAYVEMQGKEAYLKKYAESYIFGGGDPTVYEFAFGLVLEGLAAIVVVSFALMQYWKDKVEKINKVDDRNHVTSTENNNY